MNLSEIREKITALQDRITGYEEKIGDVKEKIRELEAEAFKLDQGRTLEAVELAKQANPVFAKLLDVMKEKIALQQAVKAKPVKTGTGTRGRPRKVVADAVKNPSPSETPKATVKK